MSRYVVTAMTRHRRYLMLGRLVENFGNAHRYPHPSNARQAIDSFKRRHPEYTGRLKVIDLYPR